MVGRRKYDEGCAVSHALDVIGERWALVVVRELILGPKRFTDLRAGIPGASAAVLAQRLRELQEAGVVHQHKLPPPAAVQVYELTDWGAGLEPVITHLGRWGSRSPSMPYDANRSVDSLVLSLKALFDPQAAEGYHATIALVIGEDHFSVTIADGQLDLTRGEAQKASAKLETDPQTLASLLYRSRPVDDAVRAGDATVTGDTAVVARFFQAFTVPEPAGTH
jgi:DNA-binding HxlR family transcriptional regulator